MITTELPVLHQIKAGGPRTTETNLLRAGSTTPTNAVPIIPQTGTPQLPVLTSNRCLARIPPQRYSTELPCALRGAADDEQADVLRAEGCGCQRLMACQSAGSSAVPPRRAVRDASKAVSPRRNRCSAPKVLWTVQGKSEPPYSWNTSQKITAQRFVSIAAFKQPYTGFFLPKAAFRRSVRAGPSAALSLQPAGTPDCSRQRGPRGAGGPAGLPASHTAPAHTWGCAGGEWELRRHAACPRVRLCPQREPSQPLSSLQPHGLKGPAMPQPPPAAPRCRRLRDAQQRARTAAALTAAPDADRSRTLLEPSRVRAEPRTQVAADERRAPPRPAGPRMEGRSAQPHRACPPPPFRVPRPTPASRRAVRVHPLGPAPRLSGHGVRGAVRCALRSPSKGLRVCASRAALTGPWAR